MGLLGVIGALAGNLIVPGIGSIVAVAPSGSPYTWTAPSAGMLIVSGGTVSLVEVGRGAAFYVAGLVGGLIPVSAGDKVRMTYAPTATFLGR